MSVKTFELSLGDKTYKVDVEKFDGKRALVRVDGKPYEVEVKGAGGGVPASMPDTQKVTPPTQSPPQAPVPSAPSSGEVIAPMPGLILDIMVAVGDKVAANQPVIKMEAMKMENEIPVPFSGTVKGIPVKVGDNVSTEETLMIIEQE